MSTARAEDTANLLPTGKVLIAAGAIQGANLATSELYDPAVGTFASTGSMNTPRGRHTATLLTNGKVLISGGDTDTTLSSTSSELYDPSSGSFSATDSLATGRSLHTATLLPNGQVLIAGGFGGSLGITASAELYDPNAGTFTVTGSMQRPRYAHTATLLPDGRVLITGGVSFIATTRVTEASAELYDPTTGIFTLLANSMSTARAFHTSTLLSNGKALIIGIDPFAGVALNTAEIFDPALTTFTSTGNTTTARFIHTATLLSSGQVLVAGGYDGVNVFDTAEIYDLATGLFSPTGSMAFLRSSHSATLLPNGNVLVAGGSGGNSGGGFLATAEIYLPGPETRQTVFLVHGINQNGGEAGDLGAFAANLRAALGTSGFIVDAGFDYGFCAKPTYPELCPVDCTIENGAFPAGKLHKKQKSSRAHNCHRVQHGRADCARYGAQ